MMIWADQSVAVGTKSIPQGPTEDLRSPGPPKGPFGGQNEPFWGPQEYRRGSLRGQSTQYGCYQPSWTSQWQLGPNQAPLCLRRTSRTLWGPLGPQNGIFWPLRVRIWPQSGPKCHIIVCYTRGKCFRVIWGLAWQHLVCSSFHPVSDWDTPLFKLHSGARKTHLPAFACMLYTSKLWLSESFVQFCWGKIEKIAFFHFKKAHF